MKTQEEPRGAVDEWAEQTWARVPELIRADCEKYLLSKLPDDLLAKWKDQRARGIRIGSDELMFHFGTGMWVRNTLRARLPDNELPPWGGWDDYYYGALVAAVEKAP
jgi:hypothetical protein